MKRNLILIGGATILVGVGVFLYLKSKKKSTTTTTSSDVASLQSSEIKTDVAPKPLATTPEEAKTLASAIYQAKENIKSIENQIQSLPKSTGVTGGFSGVDFNSIRRKSFETKLTNAKNSMNADLAKLQQLGYTELNGSPIKIG